MIFFDLLPHILIDIHVLLAQVLREVIRPLIYENGFLGSNNKLLNINIPRV